MVKARRPATAGVHRPPPISDFSGQTRPPESPVPQATRTSSASGALSPAPSSNVRVRPLSAFRKPGGWSSPSRTQLSWNDSAILHTEESSPVPSNRRAAANAAIPIYLSPQLSSREGPLKLEDVNEFKSPKYSSLKALPERKSSLKAERPLGVADLSSNGVSSGNGLATKASLSNEETQTQVENAAQATQTELDQDFQEDMAILPGTVEDRSLHRPASKGQPGSRRSSLVHEETQTQVYSDVQSTQTEFSVSLVKMIESALTSAPSVQPEMQGRRTSLPSVMDPSMLTSTTGLTDTSLLASSNLPPCMNVERAAQTDPMPELDLARRTTSECSARTSDSPRRLPKLHSTFHTSTGTHLPEPLTSDELPPIGPSNARDLVVLKVQVMEAAELVQSKVYGLSDPYCIVHVEGVTRRTKIVASSQDPKWDEEFTFCMKSFMSPVSLAVMDKHATRDNKLMGIVELVPGELLSRVCSGPDQHVVEAEAWVLLQNRAGIPAGGRVMLRLCTTDWVPLDKTKSTGEVVALADLAGNCLSKHDDADALGEGSPVAGTAAGGGSNFASSMKSGQSVTSGNHHAAAILEDPADLIDLFEGEKPLDEGIAAGYYSERSCWRFDRDSLFRRRVFRLVHSPAFQLASWLAAAVACFSMGLEPQPVSIDATIWSTLEFVSYFFLAFEIGLKSVAFGFADKASSFLFSAVWNVIDLVAFLSFWIEYSVPRNFQTDFTLRPFRFFRVLSPLAHFEVFTGLTTIFLSLKTAFWPFATVIAFLLLFHLGFGIFGVTFYHHSYSRRCVNALTREIIIPNRGCKTFDDGESSCSDGQVCESIESNEMGSVVNFDHITTAFVSIFQAISLDGQQDVMNRAIQSEPRYAPLGVIFFLLLTFFCRFLLFNLWSSPEPFAACGRLLLTLTGCVAVITTTFQQVRMDVSAALEHLHSSSGDSSTHESHESLEQFAPSRTSTDFGELSPARAVNGLVRRRRTQGLARRSFHDITLAIVTSPLFEIVAMVMVLVNTVAMARQAVDISDAESRMLDNLEVATQLLFVLELLVRMLGSNSLPEFFSRGHDKFDFFVILLTGMVLFARLLGISKERLGLLASLSALRFIRLVSVVPAINHLLTLTLASVTNIVNLLFFTFALFSVFAVCAVFIFGSNPEDVASQEYADYWTAMRTLFAIFIGDDWRINLYTAMQHGIETADWWRTLMPCGFVVAFFFFCQAILTNLYIAVIIENFSVATTQEVRHDPVMQEKLKKVKQYARSAWKSLFNIARPLIASTKVADITIAGRVSMSSFASTSRASSGFAAVTLNDRSLCYFTPDHPLRAWCMRTAESSAFQNLILSVIFLSMTALAIEPPARDIESGVPYAVLDAINYLSTAVFCIEFVVQAINLGLLLTPHSYFSSAWNICDFTVLVLSLLDLAGGNTKQARVLRLGRALRPLRLIKRNQGMRLMVDALLATWKPVSMIIILAFAVATIFAIMAMSLFKGRFAFCTNPSLIYPMGKDECLGMHLGDRGVMMPSAWLVPEQNFDSFTKAMMQCLTMNTMQWTILNRMAAAVTERGKAPLTDANVENVLFLVIYLIIGGLFVMNLFVAFIIDGFNQLRRVDAKNLENLANYEVFLSLVRRSSPHRKHALPTHHVRQAIAKRVLPSETFTTATTLFVFLNVFFLALYHPGRMSEQMELLYNLQNDVFFVLMVLEAATIIAGRGWLNYVEDRWNWIDIISIAATCVAYFVPESAFIRSFRLVKILRIIKNVKALQAMFETLARSIPQFTNVMLLLFLILTMFAILCVNLFGLVKEGPLLLGSPVAAWPSIRPSFKSYPVAMYTLFLVTQGEEWNLLVYDAAVQAPACTEQFEGKDYGDCGIPVMWSFLVFFSFKLVAEFVLINLFVGMIIDTFTSSNSRHVAVQFHFDVGSSTQSVRAAKSHAVKRGSVVRVSSGGSRAASSSADITSARTRARINRMGSAESSKRDSVRRVDDNLSCAECWKRMTGGGRHDFIMIADVQVLMRMLPQPLGFARDALGMPTITSTDRAICKLIWAELNILAVQRSEGSKIMRNRVLSTVRGWLRIDEPAPTETGKVTFEETFLTLFHWRCPHLVPEEIRKQRAPMLDEVVKTAHAVSISRHIRRWLAICRMRKANKDKDGQKKTGGVASALLFTESRHDTQEHMQRDVEKKREKLAAEKKKGLTSLGSGDASRIVGALRRGSLQPDSPK